MSAGWAGAPVGLEADCYTAPFVSKNKLLQPILSVRIILEFGCFYEQHKTPTSNVVLIDISMVVWGVRIWRTIRLLTL